MARAPTYLVPVIFLGGEISPLGDKKKEGLQFLQRIFWEKESAKFATFLGKKIC
jgi:hypothetical protein